jgi:hypothetical protein
MPKLLQFLLCKVVSRIVIQVIRPPLESVLGGENDRLSSCVEFLKGMTVSGSLIFFED